MSGAQDTLLYSRVETVLASEIGDGELKVGERAPEAGADAAGAAIDFVDRAGADE